jgi:cytochrome c-type biogenesis protein CcsB
VPVDVGLAELSNDLINGAIVAFSVAFLGYAIDAAYGNHAHRSVRAARAATEGRLPVLVGAATGAAAGSAGSLPGAVEGRPGGTPAARSNDASTPSAWSKDAGTPASRRGWFSGFGFAERVGTAAIVCTLIGWVLQLGAITSRGLAVHRLPWGNMYEFTLALTFAAVTAFLVILVRQPVRYLGVFLMAPVVLALGLAVLVLYVAPAPLMPALHSYWLAIHVTAAIIASGVFMVGTAATVMFLIADRYAAATKAGKRVRFAALARMMPDPETLDRTAYRAYAFAFPIWTFAVIAGAIWAEYAWGHYWQWDPKETWAFITWIVYAGYLHARATAGWRGRKAAYIAMIGFATIVFNYFVINIFISGMHSYAGV